MSLTDQPTICRTWAPGSLAARLFAPGMFRSLTPIPLSNQDVQFLNLEKARKKILLVFPCTESENEAPLCTQAG